MGFRGTLGFREAFRNLKKKFERKKNINHKTSKKMEHIKWKTYIIIAFIDLLSVYLAVGLLMGIHY